MFILFLLFVVIPAVGWFCWQKGLKESGHMCKPAPKILPGERYKPIELKYVSINCLECGHPVRAEIRIIRTFSERAKGIPYRTDLVLDDYKLHLLTDHPKADTVEGNK